MNTYIDISKIVLRDFESIESAADYCERIASQGGEDAVSYRRAAESLRKAKVYFEYFQGDSGHWFYCQTCREGRGSSVGPFMTKTDAVHHSRTGYFRVID